MNWLIALPILILTFLVLLFKNKAKTVNDSEEKTNFLNGLPLRGTDSHGDGSFNASRKRTNNDGTITKYSHKGLDISYQPNQLIKAPFDCIINRIGQVYSNNPSLKLVEIIGVNKFKGFKMKLMYCTTYLPTDKTTIYKQGTPIATTQNMSQYFSKGMTNHIHYELYDQNEQLLNPENYA